MASSIRVVQNENPKRGNRNFPRHFDPFHKILDEKMRPNKYADLADSQKNKQPTAITSIKYSNKRSDRWSTIGNRHRYSG